MILRRIYDPALAQASYLVGCPERNRWTVIDPGPDDAAHRQAILDAAPGPIERVLVTHTHMDHFFGFDRLTGPSVKR